MSARVPGLVVACLLAALPAAAPVDDAFELNEKAADALAAGKVADAVLLLESAHSQDPSQDVITRNLAYAYFLRGKARLEAFDFGGAQADYEKAVATNPDEVGYRLHLGHLLTRRYRLADAERVLSEAVALAPDSADGLLLLGDAQGLLDELPEAIATYEKAVALGAGSSSDAARAAAERVKRQYDVEKDYRTDRTDHFVIRHPLESNFLELATVLDRARTEVCNLLEARPEGRALVVLYPPDAFREVTGTHDWVGGLFDRKIRLPIGDARADSEKIEAAFRHEFTHLVVSEVAPRCPVLVNEGLAQVLEFGQGHGMQRLVEWLDDTGRERTSVPRLADLPDSFVALTDHDEVRMGYLLSYAFVDHVAQHHGIAAAMRWVTELATHPLDEAYQRATGRSLADEEAIFRELLRTAR
ncbi:MAG: hypothetical protein H6825_15545 [Planctomycetes bacterium]|nr:hypothetical protein [Planctomycetota bacterium]